MLIIRVRQLAAIAEAMDLNRSEDLLEHLRKNYSQKAKQMGDTALAGFW